MCSEPGFGANVSGFLSLASFSHFVYMVLLGSIRRER